METNDKYVSYYEINEDHEMKFDVITPNFKQVIYYVIALIIGLVLFLFRFRKVGFVLILCCIIFIFITPFLWNKVNRNFIAKRLGRSIKGFIDEKAKNYEKMGTKIKGFLGLKFNKKSKYYIEAKSIDLDLNDVGKMFSRVYDVVSVCMAMAFTIGTFYNLIIDEIDREAIATLNIVMILVIFIAPMIASWFIPNLWTIEDSAIKSIDKNLNMRIMARDIRKGFLSKFIGFSGLFIGYSFILENLDELAQELPPVDGIARYISAIVVLVIYISLISFPSILITTMYLLKYHENNVNECRKVLSENFSSGMTIIKKNTREIV